MDGVNSFLSSLNNFSFGSGDVGEKKTDETKASDAVSANVSVVGGRDNVTVGKAWGDEMTVTFELPEIDEPSEASARDRDKRCQSIVLKLGFSRGDSVSGKSILFDMYAIMTLIQQIAQQMRNALRDLRKCQNVAIYANIKAQAEVQRTAAIAGAIAGAIMCAVQVGVVFAGMGMQLKGAGSNPAAKAGNESALKQETLVKNLQEGEYGNTDLAGLQAPRGSNLHAALETAGVGRSTVMGQDSATNVIQAAMKDTAIAKADFQQAQQSYITAVKAEQAGAKLPAGMTSKDLKANMDAAQQRFDLAAENQAKVTGKIAYDVGKDFQPVQDSHSALMNNVSDLRTGADAITAQGGTLAQRTMIAGMVVQQVGMAVGNFLAQLASSIKELISTEATELQAEGKLLEEQFDQIKDLFSLMMSVIQKAIEILSSVVQKESSVIEQILQHV